MIANFYGSTDVMLTLMDADSDYSSKLITLNMEKHK